MMRRRAALLPLFTSAAAVAMALTFVWRAPAQSVAPAPSAPSAPTAPTAAQGQGEGETAYLVVHRVLMSPRCMNCHPSGDAPLHGDVPVPHTMNVTRKSSESGMACTTCHRAKNGTREGSPPGVFPEWRMPTREHPLVFQGMSARGLCEQLKDPARNGGKTLAALVEHVGHDSLVLWGWAPGPGRTLPPVSHEAFVKAFETWVKTGAPCPR